MAIMCTYAIMVLYDTILVFLCLIFSPLKWKKVNFPASEGNNPIKG